MRVCVCVCCKSCRKLSQQRYIAVIKMAVKEEEVVVIVMVYLVEVNAGRLEKFD